MLKFTTKVLNEVREFFSSFDILEDTKNTIPIIVFFSENKVYQKFSKPIIDVILSIHPGQIFYISIDKEDKINDKRINNYYVKPTLINYVFDKLKAKNLFLTVTDLGNNLLNKTKNIDKYIYFFHSAVSTTKNYTSKAFDNYDIILCVGQFQIDEIRYRENTKKLKKKILIPSGYFYFDYLIKNIDYKDKTNEILIAPSWNKNIKNSLNMHFVDLIEVLIKKNFKVIFRPHPEHFKRSKKILNNINNRFFGQNFTFDIDSNNINSMKKAKCLITDSSGIAIEYMTILKRPVLYLNENDKIHNSEFKDFSNLITIDEKFRDNFGYLFKISDFDKINLLIEDSEKQFFEKLSKLDSFIETNYFHFGDAKKFLYSNLKKII